MAYVYRHIRLDKNKPFYIGIGTRKNYLRAKTIVKRNTYWHNIVNKTDWYYEIMLDDLTIEEAQVKEKELIALYGRADLGKGELVNLTNGGDGTFGLKVSESTRERMRQFNLGKKLSKEHILKISESNKGKHLSTEAKQKMRDAKIGKKPSSDTRNKMSLSHMGNKSNLGRKLPEEQKEKMRTSQKIRRERELNGRVL